MSTAKPTPSPMKRYYIFFAVLAVVAAAAIMSNAALRRGPVHDARAAQDIRNLQAAVDNYYLRQNQLPAALADVAVFNDDTKKRLAAYEYRRTGPITYALCATFMTESKASDRNPTPPLRDVDVPNPEFHGKGRECFSYSVIAINAQDLPLRR